jgi:hypothetical protein
LPVFGALLVEVGALLAEVGGLLAEVGALLAEVGALLAEVGALLAEVGGLLAEVGALLAEVGGFLAPAAVVAASTPGSKLNIKVIFFNALKCCIFKYCTANSNSTATQAFKNAYAFLKVLSKPRSVAPMHRDYTKILHIHI